VPNITITNIDLGSVVLELEGSTDGTLQNEEEEAATFAAGTILARQATDGKFYPFATAGLDGLAIPKAVLTHEVTVAAESGVPVQVLTAGKVNRQRLVIHDATPITAAHLDLLRDFSIIPVDVTQLGNIDNPQS
jgi:hypothetical protein